MRSVVFADLDGTLIQSSPTALIAAVNREGAVAAYQTEVQAALAQWLGRADRVIPVTGRSVSAFGRVHLPFCHEAVVHHGAVVLNADGARDETYWESVRPALNAVAEVLDAEWAYVSALLEAPDCPLRTYRQVIDGVTVEVCVKHKAAGVSDLGALASGLAARWRALKAPVMIHQNGNNLALLPAEVSKASAVRWLRERLLGELGPCLTLGVGDSLSDHPFMASCDFYLVPSGSQLDRRFKASRHVG